MLKEIIAASLLTISFTNTTHKKNEFNNSAYLYGVYNFRETFENIENLNPNENVSVDIDFNTTNQDGTKQNYECIYSPDGQDIYRVSRVQISTNGNNSAQLSISCIDNLGQTTYFNDAVISPTEDVSERNYPSSILQINKSRYMTNEESYCFNAIFTHQDNSYVTTYNGYYNFYNNTTSFNRRWAVFGSLTFNNNLYIAMANSDYAAINRTNLYRYFGEDNVYDYESVNYPFTTNTEVVNSQNILFSGVKMANDTKQYLETLGAFSYIRDNSYDNATFEDLLFSIMDSPVYFISRLLSFELFGVQLFVAFTGLLTICFLLVLIRRFF